MGKSCAQISSSVFLHSWTHNSIRGLGFSVPGVEVAHSDHVIGVKVMIGPHFVADVAPLHAVRITRLVPGQRFVVLLPSFPSVTLSSPLEEEAWVTF